MTTKRLTMAELKRRLIGDSRERERLVKMLIERIREEERAKLEATRV